MKTIIFQHDQWQRIVALVFISLSALSVLAITLGIVFTFAEIKPADRFLVSSGFCTIVGLAMGLVTSPKSFQILISIRSSSNSNDNV